MAKAATVSGQLFKTIDAEILDTSGVKAPDVQAQADIVFENVSFSYPSRSNVQILQNLTTTFEAGKVTAIVGPSGSGKSTIVGLIERWYEIGAVLFKLTQQARWGGEVYAHEKS
jgi:ATP-binding cassette subfamily B (MDR/TAP) protein 1